MVTFVSIFAAMENRRERYLMATKEPVRFDPETVKVLREVLDDAWNSLGRETQAMVSKTVLAERILASAANGERDRKRLFAVALRFAD